MSKAIFEKALGLGKTPGKMAPLAQKFFFFFFPFCFFCVHV
jgi:hypothetical protein